MFRNRIGWFFVGVGLSINATGLGAERPSRSELLTDIAAPAASLVTLVEQLLSNHPQVQAARASLEAARARTRAAGKPLFNPEFELDAESAADQTTFLGVSQTIDWADKRSARIQATANEQAAARAALTNARQAVAVACLTALGDYHTAVALEALGRQRVELMQRFATLTEQRRRAGDISQVELDLARLSSIDASLQRVQAVTALAAAKQALVAVVGEARPTWPALAEHLPAIDPGALDVDETVQALPALRAQQAELAATRATIVLRQRERRPDPTIALRGGHEDTEPLVGVTVSVPLFMRNSFRAEVAAAHADTLAVEQRLHDLYRTARARLLVSAESYQQTRRAWQQWQRIGESTLERQIRLLQRTWQAGELNTTEYLVQLTQALGTRETAIELRGQFWQAWFDWLAATGRIETWLDLEESSRE
ncbi:MAG: TolC family protein [Gammaproteobacteria bacterium]|jgi:cobalt-zinc-cadmium efflux system outer membrane protein